jgi:pSer/pThr/pTyr-binding forkhead associated (FHA) protein
MAADLIRAALLYRSGPPRDFPLSDAPEAVIGFGGGSVLRVPMEGVSRRHAKVTFDGKDYWIEDAGSSNGTFVNGVRLRKKERLKHLDIVTLGRSTDLIFFSRAREAARVARTGITSAAIEAVDGGDVGTRWPIPRGHITIGRATSNNVVVDSQLISKIHARLECTATQLALTDLQSHNGTYVHGERLVEPRILKDGDEFVLGGARRFRVHIDQGIIQTSGIGPRPIQASSDVPLPMDWKTRIEWSPEELASLEDGRRGVRPGETALAAPAVRPAEAAPKPAVKPEVASRKAPEATPGAEAKREVKPGAERKREAKPVDAPKPVEDKPPAANAKPAVSPERRVASAPVPPPAAAEASLAAPPKPHVEPPAADQKPAASAPVAPPVSPPVADEPKKIESPTPAPSPEAAPAVPPLRKVRVSGEATKALIQDEATKPRVYLEGETVTLPLASGEHVVGRIPGISIRLDAHEISRRHAVIHVSNAEAVVEDLGSHNGTFVNRERIAAPRKLSAGDLLTFGDVQFRVRFPPVPGAPRKPE